MKKYLTVLASFVIMVCLGGIYAWSIVASELIRDFEFLSSLTQIIFGTLIGVYPLTMIFAGRLEKKISARILAVFSAVFFALGYVLAGLSGGNYFLILLGIGVFAGIGTGLGYLVSLTIPVRWFPDKKGLVTGIAAAGFGLGAILMSSVADRLLQSGNSILHIFTVIGLAYGSLIFVFSNFIRSPEKPVEEDSGRRLKILKSPVFRRLFLGIFLGTFAGLLVIGSLKLVGTQYNLSGNVLILGVSLFSLSNFLGRLVWGYLSDFVNTSLCIFLSLILQGLAIFLLGVLDLTGFTYLSLAMITGFGFGGNFVLFARETSRYFGVEKLGLIYPYVFLGYAIAGIAGPLTGGLLFDVFGSFFYANTIAALLSIGGGLIFLLRLDPEK